MFSVTAQKKKASKKLILTYISNVTFKSRTTKTTWMNYSTVYTQWWRCKVNTDGLSPSTNQKRLRALSSFSLWFDIWEWTNSYEYAIIEYSSEYLLTPMKFYNEIFAHWKPLLGNCLKRYSHDTRKENPRRFMKGQANYNESMLHGMFRKKKIEICLKN